MKENEVIGVFAGNDLNPNGNNVIETEVYYVFKDCSLEEMDKFNKKGIKEDQTAKMAIIDIKTLKQAVLQNEFKSFGILYDLAISEIRWDPFGEIGELQAKAVERLISHYSVSDYEELLSTAKVTPDDLVALKALYSDENVDPYKAATDLYKEEIAKGYEEELGYKR